jgi:type II secretory pathway pseudopilin PulG
MVRLRARRPALSLIELIVAVIILGIVAALTIPRFSRAATHPGERELRPRLRVLRSAIESFYYDHGFHPAARPDGTPQGATGSEAAFVSQLCQYSDADGVVSPVRDERFRFGPYLMEGVPPCPVSPRRGLNGVHVIRGRMMPRYTPTAASAGWVYNCDTGYICANSGLRDGQGVPYEGY